MTRNVGENGESRQHQHVRQHRLPGVRLAGQASCLGRHTVRVRRQFGRGHQWLPAGRRHQFAIGRWLCCLGIVVMPSMRRFGIAAFRMPLRCVVVVPIPDSRLGSRVVVVVVVDGGGGGACGGAGAGLVGRWRRGGAAGRHVAERRPHLGDDVGEEFAEELVAQIEGDRLARHLLAFGHTGNGGAVGRRLLQHEAEQPGEYGGHRPRGVPRVRMEVC